MPTLREQDFDKMATHVVDQFLNGKAKLAEAAAEAASENGLNPDQIERLSQSANTMAFLRMMDQRKQEGAGDLMHEFEPIDARHVIKLVIDDAGVHVEPMNEGAPQGAPMGGTPDAMELPDEMSGMHMNPAEGAPGHEDSPAVEQCEEGCHEQHDPPGVQTEMQHAEPEGAAGFGPAPFGQPNAPMPPKKKAPEAAPKGFGAAPFGKKKSPAPFEKKEPKADAVAEMKEQKEATLRVNRFRKLAGVMEDQYRQAEWSFEDAFEKLAVRFKRVYSDVSFTAFEKDALAEYGDAVGIGVLNMLRERRGLEALDAPSTMSKVAALADRHVSEESPELHLFEGLVKIAADASKLRKGIDYVRARCA